MTDIPCGSSNQTIKAMVSYETEDRPLVDDLLTLLSRLDVHPRMPHA